MANVLIEGHGTFTVSAEKVQDLVQWLQTNGGGAVEQTIDQRFDGDTLLNEKDTKQHTGTKPASLTDKPRIDPDKTWDFGTKWI